MRWIGLLTLTTAVLSGLINRYGDRAISKISDAAAYGLIPAFCFLAVWSIASFVWKKKISSANRMGWKIAIILVLSVFLSVPVTLGIDRARSHITEISVNETIPILNQIKLRTGKYPLDLPKRRPGLLDWLAYPVQYRAAGGGFIFTYFDEPMEDMNILENGTENWLHTS
jgi:hypothetical protein